MEENIFSKDHLVRYFIIILIIVLFLGMYLSVSIIVNKIGGTTFNYTYYIILLFVCEFLVIISYCFFIGNKEHFIKEFSLPKNYTGKELITELANFYTLYVLIGTILLFTIGYIVYFGYGRMQYYTVVNRLQNEYYFFDFSLISIFFALVMAPVFEEFIFRYILVRQFKQISDQNTFVIIGVTILFIIVHIPGDLLTYDRLALPSFFIIIIIEIGLASIFITVIYLKTESLLYAIIAHAIWNFIDLVILSFSISLNNPILTSFIEFFIMLIIALTLVLIKKNYWHQYWQFFIDNVKKNLFVFTIVFFIIIFSLIQIVNYVFQILDTM